MSGQDRDITAQASRILLRTAEPLYSCVTSMRNSFFDKGIKKSYSLGRPTISIGNITTGGTGKTPFVTKLAQHLINTSHHPAILMRGYHSTEHGSDEALAYQTILGNNVTIESNPSRIEGAKAALTKNPNIDIFLLDDGFQHRTAARDIDIVLIDATQPFGYDHVLPRGLLREPLANLKRADHIVITRASQVPHQNLKELKDKIQILSNKHVTAVTSHDWSHYLDQNNNTLPLDYLKNKSVIAATGIGNPQAFKQSLEAHSKNLLHFSTLPDHYHFTNDDITQFITSAESLNADAIIFTEKDWVKIAKIIPNIIKTSITFLRPQLDISFMEGENKLHEAINSVF